MNTPRDLDEDNADVVAAFEAAAAALAEDGVDAATILTYGQAYDPTSGNHDDQTRLWSQEQWVDFPFTEEEIVADLVSTKTVTNAGVDGPTVECAPHAATG